MRELGKISSGVLGHLDETRLLLARLTTLLFLGSPHQALENSNHCGTRPTLLNSIFIRLLIYRTDYIWFLPFHHLLLRASVHERFIQLLNCMIVVFPPLFSHFSTVYTTSIHTSGALQHCSTWILLEFLWNSTHIGTCCLDYRYISGYFLHGYMDLPHITWMVKQGFTGFKDAYHCMLWLHLHVVHCD